MVIRPTIRRPTIAFGCSTNTFIALRSPTTHRAIFNNPPHRSPLSSTIARYISTTADVLQQQPPRTPMPFIMVHSRSPMIRHTSSLSAMNDVLGKYRLYSVHQTLTNHCLSFHFHPVAVHRYARRPTVHIPPPIVTDHDA